VYGNKRKEASNVLSDFSDLMRKTLHYSDKIQITLKEELELIETYIRLEQIRFEDEFTYAIKLTLNHTPDELVIPCMIIQPFVENAFKHGLLHKRNQKQLTIEFIEDSDLIKVIVRDNGIGRKKAAEIANRNKTHSGFAVQSIKERVNLLSTATQKKLIVAIKDLTDNLGNALGTEVTILIPLKKIS
jgi:sensor histidine kinase YesM